MTNLGELRVHSLADSRSARQSRQIAGLDDRHGAVPDASQLRQCRAADERNGSQTDQELHWPVGGLGWG